jgi:hypothetical protein
MAPEAAAADRERLFARWVRELGLPLKDDVTTFEMSRFVDAGLTRLLLLESPEALDFTEEITLTLVQRRLVGPVARPPTATTSTLSEAAARVGAGRHLGERLDRLVRLGHLPRATGGGPPPPPPPPPNGVRDAVATAGGLRVELDASVAPAGDVVVARVEADGSATMFRGRPRVGAADPGVAFVDAEPVEAPLAGAAERRLLARRLQEASVGSVFVLTSDLTRLIGHLPPQFEDVPVDVRVIANGDATKAIVVPVDSAGAVGLATGHYRLTARLKRRRWETTDAEDELNTYKDEAVLSLSL